jgi:hypothetical protein
MVQFLIIVYHFDEFGRFGFICNLLFSHCLELGIWFLEFLLPRFDTPCLLTLK